MTKDMRESIERWREHPNYGQTCVCTHRSVFHTDGEKECWFPECQCQAFVNQRSRDAKQAV